MIPSFIRNETIDLERMFALYQDQPALVTASGTQTFSNIRETLQIVVANLRRAGVRHGDCIALYAENGELHLYLLLAAWLTGCLCMPLDFKAPLAGLLEERPVDWLATAVNVPDSFRGPVLTPADVLHRPAPMPENESWPAVSFEQESSVIFTSGSTGKPRGIVHTVGNYVYSALGTNVHIGVEPTDRWLLSLPLYHVGGILIWIRTLLSGCACILPETMKHMESSILRDQPSILSLVPTQLMRFLGSETMVAVLQKAKTILLGGAPSPAWLLEKALDLGIPVMPSYGATESSAQLTGVPRNADRGDYLTSGRVLPYRDLRIDQNGTILLGGKTVFKRYFNESSERIDYYFKTNDIGYLDPAGNLVVLGRKDGIFISGGENIHPFEIENALLAMKQIATAIVVPAPHAEFGLVPWAFVEVSGPFDETAVMAALRARLPGYKIPKRIIRLEPGGGKGKMKHSRASLTQRARQMAGQDPEGRP